MVSRAERILAEAMRLRTNKRIGGGFEDDKLSLDQLYKKAEEMHEVWKNRQRQKLLHTGIVEIAEDLEKEIAGSWIEYEVPIVGEKDICLFGEKYIYDETGVILKLLSKREGGAVYSELMARLVTSDNKCGLGLAQMKKEYEYSDRYYSPSCSEILRRLDRQLQYFEKRGLRSRENESTGELEAIPGLYINGKLVGVDGSLEDLLVLALSEPRFCRLADAVDMGEPR